MGSGGMETCGVSRAPVSQCRLISAPARSRGAAGKHWGYIFSLA